jgi:hypothetical protein
MDCVVTYGARLAVGAVLPQSMETGSSADPRADTEPITLAHG